MDRDHPVYDTLFVALAIALDVKVVTADARLLGKFPEHAISIEQYLGTAGSRGGDDVPAARPERGSPGGAGGAVRPGEGGPR